MNLNQTNEVQPLPLHDFSERPQLRLIRGDARPKLKPRPLSPVPVPVPESPHEIHDLEGTRLEDCVIVEQAHAIKIIERNVTAFENAGHEPTLRAQNCYSQQLAYLEALLERTRAVLCPDFIADESPADEAVTVEPATEEVEAEEVEDVQAFDYEAWQRRPVMENGQSLVFWRGIGSGDERKQDTAQVYGIKHLQQHNALYRWCWIDGALRTGEDFDFESILYADRDDNFNEAVMNN